MTIDTCRSVVSIFTYTVSVASCGKKGTPPLSIMGYSRLNLYLFCTSFNMVQNISKIITASYILDTIVDCFSSYVD